MVYLDADKQTYADLNVTGNVYGEQAALFFVFKSRNEERKVADAGLDYASVE